MKLFPSKLTLALAIASGLSVTNLSYATNDTIQAGNGIAVVQTQSGEIQGYIHNDILTYKGIPYATAERFMPPKPVENWQGTKMALTYGDVCPQVPIGGRSFFFTGPEMTESEQCLNLNVWAPKNDGKKRAVMVWIHGGGFQSGASNDLDSYDGENLARKGDVVVVSVNHRLNAMGYLDLSAYGKQYKNSANAGIQDLVAALEWVKANAEQFGGDPNNVTIFGESGGGAKVLTLMGTPAAKGLFHKAVVESGAVEKMGMTLTSPKTGQRVAELTLANLGVKPTALNRLNSFTPDQINAAANKALKQTAEEQKITPLRGTGYGLAWAPTMDGDYIPQEPVGKKYPEIAKDIPLLIGSNLTEWESFGAQLDLVNTQKDNRFIWTEAQVQEKLKAKYGEKTDEIVAAFREAYPDRMLADALYVDSFLRAPALKTASLKSDQKGAPVYNYLFTWDTPVFNGTPMSYHTAEIAFVFNNIQKMAQATGGGDEAQALADKMARAWTNFAKAGNPNGEGLPQWDAYTRENGNVMIFDNKVEAKQHHDAKLQRLLAPSMKF
ncbi:carboxylesterase [Aggregatibacter actinomycetemcomitans]|uniref:Carboxylic ester hydrolase n=1 Tax=Aggregatibacter actinomycetemcomitans TaxID=714 RepID=A0A5D0ENB5_AGGAC|nr:carboxylesterase family protein [Aggregatibacter actinomycetemcomitans]AFI86788.1 carboxylesterase [Aggregatibacter actinomycetemcomitans D7S-1]AMQ93927.1 carboxylesterase [Aggregatibacter actinomycetemcomitans]EKX99080.1 Carboxylesterase [Aggregatibacter actinomycetemcomitans Y4]KND85630.1 carboxylesterase [Aggregatibacter actinomycetemcomitans serotype a str. H5P1]KYK91406.1 carboxylesterase [Aggregatibacter actinomycetemcomitans serotype d str. SA508]